MEGRLRMTQVLFSFLFLVQTIAAVGVDPVEFLLSKDSPRNKPQVPLPVNFAYSGDPKTDCCSLALWVTVKDWSPRPDPEDYEDSGEEPPEERDKEPQIGPGVVTFNLSHPQIRNGDEIFSMNYVKNDIGQVKERFIIKFVKCGSITHKIFGIYTSTNIVDIKDIRIEITNGKDIGINCTINIPTTESGITWQFIAIFGWVIAIVAVIVCVVQYLKYKKGHASSSQPEKAPGAGGYTGIKTEESGYIKTTRGGPRNTTLNAGDKNNVVCGRITKDNLFPLITGVIAVISFVVAIIATIMNFIPNDTPTQMANDVVQSPTL